MWQERRGVKNFDFRLTPFIDNARAFTRELILREKIIYMLGYSNKKPSKSEKELTLLEEKFNVRIESVSYFKYFNTKRRQYPIPCVPVPAYAVFNMRNKK